MSKNLKLKDIAHLLEPKKSKTQLFREKYGYPEPHTNFNIKFKEVD